jgi:hypothetical protein
MSRYKIIAVDFNGCLVENKYPDIGEPIRETIEALKAEQAQGARVILWTCRRDQPLTAAVDWCKAQGIRLDTANANLPEMVKAFGGDTIKVYADEYWDDRAVRMPPSRDIAAIRAQLLDLAKDRQSFFNDTGDDQIFRDDYEALVRAVELLESLECSESSHFSEASAP